MRPITLKEAKRRYVHRYTLEHVPLWGVGAVTHAPNGLYYAPQYATDQEWYDNTSFPGENGSSRRAKYCESRNQSWPLGQWLDAPYRKKA